MAGKGSILDSTFPAFGAFEITPHDTNNFTKNTRGIFVGTGGELAVVMANDDEVTFSNVQSGCVLPIQCKRVLDTGTTATNLVGVY